MVVHAYRYDVKEALEIYVVCRVGVTRVPALSLRPACPAVDAFATASAFAFAVFSAMRRLASASARTRAASRSVLACSICARSSRLLVWSRSISSPAADEAPAPCAWTWR